MPYQRPDKPRREWTPEERRLWREEHYRLNAERHRRSLAREARKVAKRAKRLAAIEVRQAKEQKPWRRPQPSTPATRAAASERLRRSILRQAALADQKLK